MLARTDQGDGMISLTGVEEPVMPSELKIEIGPGLGLFGTYSLRKRKLVR